MPPFFVIRGNVIVQKNTALFQIIVQISQLIAIFLSSHIIEQRSVSKTHLLRAHHRNNHHDNLQVNCTMHSTNLSTPGQKRTALEVAEHYSDNIKRKLFIVTGAYSGIGVETVRALLKVKGKVVIGCRNPNGQAEFADKMKEEFPDGYIEANTTIDLGELESVSNFAKTISSKYDKINCLICNAGMAQTSPKLTKDGFEMQMGVNVIRQFLLAKILAPNTTHQVWLSSIAHKLPEAKRIDIEYIKSFDPKTSEFPPLVGYQQSKLGNLLLAKEFLKRFNGLESASLHPGAVNSGWAVICPFANLSQPCSSCSPHALGQGQVCFENSWDFREYLQL